MLCVKNRKKKCYFWIIEKIPCISSLFHENKFETAFRVKADIFKYFLAKQCLLIHNDTSLPFEIQKKTKNSLYSVENIWEIISNLCSIETNGHDGISIKMLKLYDPSVCRPLQIIYKSCLDSWKFPQEWKNANVGPVHKKW